MPLSLTKKPDFMKFPACVVALFLFGSSTINARDIRISSPNGRIVFVFTLTKTAPAYQVLFDKKTMVDASLLTLTFQESGVFGPNLNVDKPLVREIDETYDLVVGKVKIARNHCREGTLNYDYHGPAQRRQLVYWQPDQFHRPRSSYPLRLPARRSYLHCRCLCRRA